MNTQTIRLSEAPIALGMDIAAFVDSYYMPAFRNICWAPQLRRIMINSGWQALLPELRSFFLRNPHMGRLHSNGSTVTISTTTTHRA